MGGIENPISHISLLLFDQKPLELAEYVQTHSVLFGRVLAAPTNLEHKKAPPSPTEGGAAFTFPGLELGQLEAKGLGDSLDVV
jgi:hypothetical protein